MIRDLRLVAAAIRLSWFRESEFAGDLVVSFLHFAVQLGVSIVFWVSLMASFQSIGGWSLPDLILLSCFFELIPLVDIFFVGFRHLPTRVRAGELDKYLYRPCNPILGLLSESLYIRYPIYQAVTAAVLLTWAVGTFHLSFSVLAILKASSLFLIGVWVTRLIKGTVTLATFWIGKVDSLQMILGLFSRLADYPITIYGPTIQGLLTYVVPYGLVATLPVLVLNGWNPKPWFWVIALALLAAWSWIFHHTWRAALRHYEAFGG